MKTKKIVMAVLSAALVIAFIIGCNIPQEITDSSSDVEQLTPDGKVRVRLNITDSKTNPRTVVPVTTGYSTLANFDHFNVIIKNSSNTDVTPDGTANTGDFNWKGNISSTQLTTEVMPLTPGQYTFTIIAFNNVNTNGSYKLAMGSNTVTVGSSNSTVSISLKEIVDGEGKGSFGISSNASGYDTATLTLVKLVGTSSVILPSDSNIKSGFTTIQLDSGYYRMTIALGASGKESVSVIEIVHIYEGFLTTYSTTLPTLRSNLYKIDYVYTLDSGARGSAPADENVSHGNNITNTAATGCTPPTNMIFGAWYDDVDSGAVAGNVVTGSTKIIKPLTLYAKWEPSSVNASFSPISIEWTSPIVPTFSGAADYNQSTSDIDFTITLTNPGNFVTSSIVWYDDNGSTLGSASNTVNVKQSLDSGPLNWYQQGAHTITFEAKVSGGGTQIYSGQITITCTAAP